MQKKLRTLLVITIMTLTACGKQATPDETVTATSSTVQEELLIESENATDFVESVERGEAFDLSDLSPIEALKKVLLSEQCHLVSILEKEFLSIPKMGENSF